MPEEWLCPTCQTRLVVSERDHAFGQDDQGNTLPVMTCPRSGQTWGLRREEKRRARGRHREQPDLARSIAHPGWDNPRPNQG
jgi:hypothetical protein